MIIQLISLPLHIFWCYLLTDLNDLGIKGTAYASIITSLINFIMYWVYSSMFTEKEIREQTWFLPRNITEIKECCNAEGLWVFVKVGVGSMGTICLEWWSFEVMILLATMLSVKAVAVQLIIFNNGGLFFMPCAGLQVGAIVLIG